RLVNPTVPRDLETICLKCLRKAPDKRYATAQEVADELRRLLRDEPIQARPGSPAERRGRLWCPHTPLVRLIVLVLVLGAVGLTGILWQWRRATAGESEARLQAYAAKISLAQQYVRAGSIDAAQNILLDLMPRRGEPDLRGFEWPYLVRLSS